MLSWDEFETKENKVSPATIQKKQELTSSEPTPEVTEEAEHVQPENQSKSRDRDLVR